MEEVILYPFPKYFLIVFALVWFTFDIHEAAIFQTIWFTYSVVSNLVGMHVIRTAKIPFKQSHASKAVYFSSILLCIVAMIVPYTFLGRAIGLTALAPKYFSVITFAIYKVNCKNRQYVFYLT